jgi:hypothetical protein
MKANEHRCRAQDCDAVIPTSMLMCRPHWRLVPAYLKTRVLNAYADYLRGREGSAREAAARGQVLRDAQAAAVEAVGSVRVGAS